MPTGWFACTFSLYANALSPRPRGGEGRAKRVEMEGGGVSSLCFGANSGRRGARSDWGQRRGQRGLGPGRSRGAQRRASKDRKEDVQCWLLGGLRSEYPQPEYAHAPHVTMTVTYALCFKS